MKSKGKISNLLKYGVFTLAPQVDVDIMRPIFEEVFSRVGHFLLVEQLYKNFDRDELNFGVSTPIDALPELSYAYGIIRTKKPNKEFQEWSPKKLKLPFMMIDILVAPKGIKRKMTHAFEEISKRGGIQQIVNCFEYELESNRALVNKSCIPEEYLLSTN